MKRYIDADKLKEDVMQKSSHLLCEWDTAGVLAAIDRQETADVRPEKHGHWKRSRCKGDRSDHFCCSECGHLMWHVTKFCPHCGAKMDGKDTK